MTIRLLAFGIAKEIVGSSRIEIDVAENISSSSLKQLLGQTYPPLQKLKSFILAVNYSYANDNQVIMASDEIAIIPPVSGG